MVQQSMFVIITLKEILNRFSINLREKEPSFFDYSDKVPSMLRLAIRGYYFENSMLMTI